jgi:hypothetical protein
VPIERFWEKIVEGRWPQVCSRKRQTLRLPIEPPESTLAYTRTMCSRKEKGVEGGRQKPENGTRSVVVSFRERAMRLPPPACAPSGEAVVPQLGSAGRENRRGNAAICLLHRNARGITHGEGLI